MFESALINSFYLYHSNEFCLKLGHGVFFGLIPIFVFAIKPATPLSSSHTCTTIDGVETLFPKRVTSFDGCNSWFLPIKSENIICYHSLKTIHFGLASQFLLAKFTWWQLCHCRKKIIINNWLVLPRLFPSNRRATRRGY